MLQLNQKHFKYQSIQMSYFNFNPNKSVKNQPFNISKDRKNPSMFGNANRASNPNLTPDNKHNYFGKVQDNSKSTKNLFSFDPNRSYDNKKQHSKSPLNNNPFKGWTTAANQNQTNSNKTKGIFNFNTFVNSTQKVNTDPKPQKTQENKPVFGTWNNNVTSPFKFAPLKKQENKNTVLMENSQNNQNIVEELRKQLAKRDSKIESLENQIKLLTEGMTMCIKSLNQNTKHAVTNPMVAPQPSINTFSTGVQKTPAITQKSRIFGQILFKSGSSLKCQDRNFTLITQNLHKGQHYTKIQNKFGKIIFNEYIQLSKISKPLHEWLQISNNNVTIHIAELRGKAFEVFFNNFMNYKQCNSPHQMQIIVDFVNQIKNKHNGVFQQVDFDFQTGMLYAKCKGL